MTLLVVHKVLHGRAIIGLRGIKVTKEIQLRCPYEKCPGRIWDHIKQKCLPPVFKSVQLRQIVLPKKHYGLDVIMEIGKRAFGDYRSGVEITKDLHTEFELDIAERTVYRLKDLFEDLCAGVIEDHHTEIAQKLQEQPIFVLTLDATQLGGEYSLYRARDFLSGLCLGTILVDEGRTENLRQWRQELFERFGLPDAIVSDGEAALHLDPAQEPDIPHQDCWQHVEDNIWKVLIKSWRSKATSFLQKHAYRVKCKNWLAQLKQSEKNPGTVPGKHLKDLLELFVADPPTGSSFEDPMAVRLEQFRQARTVVNQWVRTLQGQKTRANINKSHLTIYQALKARLPPQERVCFISHDLLAQHPEIQVLSSLKELLDQICTSKSFGTLCASYKTLSHEFDRLRSWVLEAVIRRNQSSPWMTAQPKTMSEEHLVRHLRQTTQRAERELARIPRECHAWRWDKGEPEKTLEWQAHYTFQRLINRWTGKGQHYSGFQKATDILTRQQPQLLTFLTHEGIPISNQALETDNGQLKQIWRRSSGGQDRSYTLIYHGNGTSMVRNCYQGDQTLSPLEILGFSKEIIETWLKTCSLESLKKVQDQKAYYTRIRQLRLKAKHQTIPELFKHTTNDWLSWMIPQLTRYVEEKGL